MLTDHDPIRAHTKGELSSFFDESPGTAYVLNHNWIADFMRNVPHYHSFEEKPVPGRAWIIVVSPNAPGDGAQAMYRDVRQLLDQISHVNRG